VLNASAALNDHAFIFTPGKRLNRYDADSHHFGELLSPWLDALAFSRFRRDQVFKIGWLRSQIAYHFTQPSIRKFQSLYLNVETSLVCKGISVKNCIDDKTECLGAGMPALFVRRVIVIHAGADASSARDPWSYSSDIVNIEEPAEVTGREHRYTFIFIRT